MVIDEKFYGRLHALVVNNEQSMISIISTILQSMGVQHIERALDGEKALALLQDDPEYTDFIICDWTLPKMSGLELLKNVRKTNSKMPFLMVASSVIPEDVKASVEVGVSQYLVKPFTADDLKKRVRTMMKVLVS
ncbi:MAG: response regulator [Rhodospirillales bacterium]|nr:response regulator [Rhodospirillales bacterium]